MVIGSWLALTPELGAYINPVKVGVVIAVLLGWAYGAQWVDRDTDVVKTQREQWNLIVLLGGLVGFAWLFFGPWHGSLFGVGIGGFAAIAGGAMFFYVLHRNSRATPANRVLTVAHVKRLVGHGVAKKAAGPVKGIRVQVHDHNEDFVEPPADVEDAKGYSAIQDFLHDLLWRRAEEADMVAGKEKYRLVFRIDGVATELKEGIPSEQGDAIIRFLKKIAGLNVEEIRRPQSGTIQAGLLSKEGDPGTVEVYTSGSTAGERLRLKIQAGPMLMRLNELGLNQARQVATTALMGKSHGMVIITSPPGHGLTTTQYAIVRSHDAYINNIHALERKSLVDLDNITQQIYEGANTDVNFARMLQSVLRREPDIVMIGECEDKDTARIAAQAAATDRKIYMGMAAKDSFEALSRLLGWVGDTALVAKCLLGVTGQRLVRVLCTDCREAYEPDPTILKKLNLPAEKIECFYRPPSQPKVSRRGKEVVCETCQGTGYVGRIGVFELLVVDDAVRTLIQQGAPIERIKSQCRKNKMYYLQEEGLLKVIDGTTSMNEVLRCLKNSDK